MINPKIVNANRTTPLMTINLSNPFQIVYYLIIF